MGSININYGEHYKSDKKQPFLWSKLLESIIMDEYHVYKLFWIPVTKKSFGNVGERYKKAIKEIIDYGYIYTQVSVQKDYICLSYCIEDGGYGDEDGYGSDDCEFLVAKMDFEGQFVEPFNLEK